MQTRYWLGFLLLISMSFNVVACDKPVVISFTGDWQPYFYKQTPSTYTGTDYNFLVKVIDTLSCQLKVLHMTEMRVSKEIQKGTFDISLGASWTSDRQLMYHFSKPYREEVIGFAYLETDPENRQKSLSLASLLQSGGTVAINANGYFGDRVQELRRLYPNQFIHRFALPDRLTLMYSGAVDAVVDDRAALCFAKHSHQNKHFRVSSETLHANNVHFIFSKSAVSDAWVEAFNNAMQPLLETDSNYANSSC